MGCLNPLSFQLFYRRVQQRIAEWILVVIQLVLALGSAVPQQSGPNASSELRLQWWRFETLGEEHLRLYSRIPGTTVMNEQQGWRYLYALLSRRRMGLGP